MIKFLVNCKKNLKPIPLSIFNFLLALWLALGLNFTFFQKAIEYSERHGLQAVLWGAILATVLSLYYFIFLQILVWQWNKKWLAIVLIIIGSSAAYFVNEMGIPITSEQIQNMMQTDHKEAFHLLSTDLLIHTFLFTVLPSLIVWFIPIQPSALLPQLIKKILSIVGALIIAGIILYINLIDFSSLFRGHREVKYMISPNNIFDSSLSYYKKLSYKPLPLVQYGLDAKQTVSGTQQKPKLMVLVVGETARAESFSLNGYKKNTNPELSKVPDLINFSQATSCGTATAVSVPCMFSGMPRVNYDSRLATHREGLLDIAQRAGYKVTWIDNNSGCKGACDRVNQYKIPEELEKKYCEGRDYCADGILVESLARYIQDIPKDDPTPQLIVLHQMGSHGPAYYQRTLPEYAPFHPICDTNTIQSCDHESLINAYDNSIVYTDHILSEVIGMLKTEQKYQTGFWYLSDHGESTGENGLYLHGAMYAIAPSQQTHIPMLMWFSPEWNKKQIECLSQSKDRSVSQDNLFPTLLGLLDVNTQVINSKLDLLSQCGANNK